VVLSGLVLVFSLKSLSQNRFFGVVSEVGFCVVSEIRVEGFKSRVWQGCYDVVSNTILVNENLSGAERFETLKHELLHAHFYTETVLGRIVRLFALKKVLPFYVAVAFLAWLFSPLVCSLVLLPLFVACLEEVHASVRVFSFESLVVSVVQLLVLCGLLWFRVAPSF
jgi:hypothetical protein